MAATGGIITKETKTAADSATVFVKAKGEKSFPSGPVKLNTGMKLTMVVNPAQSHRES